MTRRRRRWSSLVFAVLVVCLAVVTVGLAVTAVAGAQECEGRGCPTTTTTVPEGATTTTAPATSGPPPTYVRAGDGLVPEVQLAAHPSSNYDVGCDEGAWDNMGRKGLCFIQSSAFQAGRVLAVSGIYFLHAVISAPYEKVLEPVVAGIGQAMTVFSSNMELLYWGLWLSILAGSFLFLRGRGMTAVSEVATSIVALVIAGTMLGDIGGMYTGTMRTIRSLSMLAVNATNDNPSDDPEQAIIDFDRGLHRAFVEQPWLALNWGGPAKVAACQPAVDQALSEGPNENDDRPRVLVATYGTKVDPDKVNTDSETAQQVKSALGWGKAVAQGPTGVVAKFLDRDGGEVALADVKGPCAEAAAFNAKPTGDRAGGAVGLAVAALFVFIFLARVAMKQVFRGIIVAIGFATLPVSVALLAFPGDIRDAAFRHIAWIAKSAVHMVGSFLMLGVVVAAVRGITSYQVDPAVPGADIVGSMAFRFILLGSVALVANLMLGTALKKVGAATVRGTARVAGAVKPTGATPAFAAGAALGATGMMGAMAAATNRAGVQVRNVKTLGSAVQSTGQKLGSVASAVRHGSFQAAAAPFMAANAAARAAAGAATKARTLAGQVGQPMAQAAQLAGAGWQVSPDMAARAPVARQTMQTIAVRTHAAAHGRTVKPTARIVARGDDGVPRVHAPGQGGKYLYNETKAERHTLPTYQAAVGGTLFPTREAQQEWQRRTEHRVARVYAAVGRPLTPKDLDPTINGDRARYVIARSQAMHRQTLADEAQRRQTRRQRKRGA